MQQGPYRTHVVFAIIRDVLIELSKVIFRQTTNAQYNCTLFNQVAGQNFIDLVKKFWITVIAGGQRTTWHCLYI